MELYQCLVDGLETWLLICLLSTFLPFDYVTGVNIYFLFFSLHFEKLALVKLMIHLCSLCRRTY